MNRLESIKERLNLRKHRKTLSNAPRFPGVDYVDQDELDIEYLIQRLERYEYALKKIGTTETLMQAKFFAMEALKEE